MKKIKNPIYLRYEFSNEAGRPEGGDILQYASTTPVYELVMEILKVAQSDHVAVNLTVGREKPFMGFLKNSGMSKKDITGEILHTVATAKAMETALAPQKAAPKKSAKKKTSAKKKK